MNIKTKSAAVYPRRAQGVAPASAREDVAARTERLNERAWALRRADPERARDLSKEAGKLAEGLGDARGLAYSLLTVAACAVDVADYELARARVKEARQLAVAAKDLRAQARAELILGIVYTRVGSYDQALGAHGSSLLLFQKAADELGEGEVLMYTGGVYLDQGDYTRSLDYLRQGLDIFTAFGDLPGQAQAFLMIAVAYGHLGKYEVAMKHNLMALELKEQLGDIFGQVVILNNLGGDCETSGDSARALEYYLEGLRREEYLGNTQMRAMLFANIAEIYGSSGKVKQAIGYALEGFKIEERLGHRRGQGETLTMLGTLYSQAGDDATALTYQQRALEVSEAIGDVHVQAASLCKLAGLHHNFGESEKAASCYTLSWTLAHQIEHKPTEVDALLGLAALASAQDDAVKQRTHLLHALELASSLDLRRPLLRIYKALSESSERTGDHREALAYYKRHHEVYKVLHNEQIAVKTHRLLKQLELERAEKDAEIQRLRNVELVRANAELGALNTQNAALLKRLREQAVKLEQQAREDALTGLYNRRHLEAQLKQEFTRAKRYGHALSVALLDIDNFKAINDRFSHQVGDKVLKAVAKIFADLVRSVDIVARAGGEEFVIVFPEITVEQGKGVCERIREAVESHPWESVYPDLRVTISVGVAGNTAVADHEKLLSLADWKLYDAKGAGKNQIAG